jgi:hypothetical protein
VQGLDVSPLDEQVIEQSTEMFSNEPRTLTPQEARIEALRLYRQGRYGPAEQILTQLLNLGFEVPSTHLHLARIALTTDHLAVAREHVDHAWEHRTDAMPEIVPRIFWMQLALRYLSPDTNGTTDPAVVILGRLKTALTQANAHLEWAMDPVLAYLQPRIPAEDHELLTALVAALGDANRVQDLDRFPAWCAADPVPF